ncbi:MAG: low molecular weight phosphotyrosine protein phosphatase [Clostridia bacterium]|nr:low molecular weight phosphotyrosine protein phosphatase [Clostridia bacterium]
MIKILFVCHGNICRSPMAEFIFKDIAKKQGVEEKFYIKSCATSTEEIIRGVGNPVYPPAKRELEKHGIKCDGKRAVQLTKNDYENYDMLIAMDNNNIRNMLRILGGDPQNKVYKLMEFVGSNADVADPWYTGDFDITYRDILSGCTALFDSLNKL